jgi:hypothetical protein
MLIKWPLTTFNLNKPHNHVTSPQN